jgi:predicted phosphoadenosine phosphosulfate sulfurtransferase
MKKILTIAMCLISSSAIANYNGVWATNQQACKSDWVRISPTVISGKNWKCNIVTVTESSTEKVVSAFCGYDKTDVTFQDLIKISKVYNYIIFTFEGGKTGLVNCKQYQ